MPNQEINQLFLDTLDQEVRERVEETGIPVEDWVAAKGGKEDILWWQKHGPEMVDRWLVWRESMRKDRFPWEIWEWEGYPAVELDLIVKLGDSPYRCIIDRVFEVTGPITDHEYRIPPKELVIVDLKTGTRPPGDDLQLSLNAAAIEVASGRIVRYGGFWMAREGGVSVRELRYDRKACEQIVAQYQRARAAEWYVPHVTNLCKYCPVRDACWAVGGKMSQQYDTLHPLYNPTIELAAESASPGE